MHDNHATARINTNEYTLQDLEQDCWKQLTAAPDSQQDDGPGSGFKTMTLATRTLDDTVDARTVVLRQADGPTRKVWFHTDVRAAKVLQLEAFPEVQLLFWNDKQQVQLRIQAQAKLHIDDSIATKQWEALRASSRKMYLSEHTPGSVLPHPYPGFPESVGENLPSEAESEAGRKNFAVVECIVNQLEYLHLSRGGQTRAQFRYEPEPLFSWLAP